MAAPINILETVNGTPLEGAMAFGSEHQLLEVSRNAAVIKPGRLATRDGSDAKVKLPTTAAEVLACRGVTELTDTQKLNSSGEYPVLTRLSIVRKGVVWMKVVDAVVQGGDVYVYYGAGDATLRGRCGGAFSSGQNAKLPGAKWFTTQATPDGFAAVEFDLPGDAASQGSAGTRTLGIVVTYDGSGVPTIVAANGVSIVDTGTGVFQLVVAGAASVLPLGSPIKLKATPDSSDAPASLFEVEAIAATSVTYSHRVLQADATPAGDAADPANGDKIYVGLLVTYA